MEVKSIEQIKTQSGLVEAVEYYRQIQEEIDRLIGSKAIARQSILDRMNAWKLRVVDTPSGFRARIYAGKGREYIDVSEARALLDEDTFAKLLKVGDAYVSLSVRAIKQENNEYV